MKNIILISIFSLIIVFISIFSLIFAFHFLNSPAASIPEQGYEIEVKPGATINSMAKILKKQKLIRSVNFLKIYIKLARPGTHIKTGFYWIEPDDSTVKIVNKMIKGDTVKIKVTFPEGFTVKHIIKRLVEKKVISPDQAAAFNSHEGLSEKYNHNFKTLEGFLFPDTYLFAKGTEITRIIKHLLSQFYLTLTYLDIDIKEYSSEELYNKIILASLVERETKDPAEAALIAGVFLERLRRGIKLQSCATIQYILDKPKEFLLFKDLEILNPYNTYIYKGFPPGPICNPGKIALKAAFFPHKTDYLFFVKKDNNTHYFSKTYKEHLNAQQRFQASIEYQWQKAN